MCIRDSFYLDQVNRSNWSFSRIKQDIATSLRGNQGGWNPGHGGPSGTVLCESENNRYRECRTCLLYTSRCV